MLQEILNYIQTAAGGSEMITSAITLSVVGIAASYGRSVPTSIYNFVKRQLTTTLVFNNGDYASNETFVDIATFLNKNANPNGIRSLKIETMWGRDNGRQLCLSIGYGIHFTIYNGRILQIRKSTLESNGTERQKEEITITALGRSHKVFEELVAQHQPGGNNDKTCILKFEGRAWDLASEFKPAKLETLALNPDFHDNITGTIDKFFSSKARFEELGLAYKLTFLLHGLPGSGKTALIRALAGHYDLAVCTLNLSNYGDESLMKAFAAIPAKSIVLIEDFDNVGAVMSRGNDEVTKGRQARKEKEKRGEDVSSKVETTNLDTAVQDGVMAAITGLTISGILNALDGLNSLSDCLIFLTTNHLEKIDPALYRKGRVDHVIELPCIRSEVVKEHFEKLYPTLHLDKYPALEAKDITGVKIESDDDVAKVKENLIKLL